MKTTDKVKRIYVAPNIENIKLDNEISLALASTPPGAPGEGYLNVPEYLKNDPLKTDMA
jgi:hypothetical protein